MNNLMKRAKRKDNGEWIHSVSMLSTVNEVFLVSEDTMFVSNAKDGKMTSLVCTAGGFIAVDPGSLGSYTGYEDKHGVSIFEDDVVKGFNTFHNREERYVVARTEVGLMLCENGNEWHPDHIEQLEVIGNLWDNPELDIEVGRN